LGEGGLRFYVYNPAKITKYGIMVRMVCESMTGYIRKLMIYDASGMTLQDTVFELLDPYLGQGYSVHSIQFFPIVSKAKPPGKKSHLNFMQTVSRNFQGSEMNSPAISASPAASDTTSLASTPSSQPSKHRTPKTAPAKDPPFRLDGKRKEHVLLKLPPMKSDSNPTRRCRVCLKNKNISETRWYCKKCGVPLHPGRCDTRYHSLKSY
jgi:hypothetical protein